MQAGIGEMVHEFQLEMMNKFIEKHGEDAFSDAVFNHAFMEVHMAYCHPCDELKASENFEVIQSAFIRAYG